MSQVIDVPGVAQYVDKYGDTRTIHKTPNGLRVKNKRKTPVLAMNPVVSEMVGERVRELRLERGLSLEQLATLAGMGTGHPKERMWQIENATRGAGVRMGTLYALAMALGVEATDLLPSTERVRKMADLCEVEMPVVKLRQP